jgi:hypothetical protein
VPLLFLLMTGTMRLCRLRALSLQEVRSSGAPQGVQATPMFVDVLAGGLAFFNFRPEPGDKLLAMLDRSTRFPRCTSHAILPTMLHYVSCK